MRKNKLPPEKPRKYFMVPPLKEGASAEETRAYYEQISALQREHRIEYEKDQHGIVQKTDKPIE